MEERDVEIEWKVSASSGRQHIVFRYSEFLPDGPEVLCAISIGGDFWDRGRPVSEAALVADFNVALPQVRLEVAHLEELLRALDDWLLRRTQFECRIDSGAPGSQEVIFSLGADEALISSRDKPVLTFVYRAGPTMVAKWAFVVDQSCISQGACGLRKFLIDIVSK